jgi:hypothetical protein
MALTAAAFSLAGCGGQTVSHTPQAAATLPAVPAFSAAANGSAVVTSDTLTVPFPSSSGFSGDLTLPVASVPANDTFAIVLSSAPPDGASPLDERRVQSLSSHTTIDYVCIAFSGGFVSTQAPELTFTLPAGFTSVAGSYYLAQLTPNGWDDDYAGPGKVATNQVTFTGPGPLTFIGGTPDCFGLLYLPPGAAAPTPSASESPAANASPTPSPSASASVSPSPIPSASPSPSPAPSVLAASPMQVNLIGVGAANAQTISVTETGYSGTFGEIDDCTSAGYATVTTTGTPSGPSATFTVTGEAAGECSITFSDSSSQTTSVFVSVTTTGYVIESHRR